MREINEEEQDRTQKFFISMVSSQMILMMELPAYYFRSSIIFVKYYKKSPLKRNSVGYGESVVDEGDHAQGHA